MAKIQLLNVQFTEVNLDTDSFDPHITDNISEPKFGVNCLTSKTNLKSFAIKFDIGLRNETKDFSLKVTSVAHFESDEDLDDGFLTSDFVVVNAPAIAFPYVRAFISNFILSSGFSPVFMPTFNFMAMASARKEKELKAKTAVKQFKKKN